MFRFEELEIWKLAVEYAKDVYNITEKLPSSERYNIVDQLRRAALSISNNIAEGSGTATVRNFKSFLDIGVSSCLERVNLLYFAFQRKYISEEERLNFYNKAETLIKKIRAFKNSLN